MLENVLFVCVGNICRSPMAEALLRARLGTQGRVESAGLNALEGHPADPMAQQLMSERGLDLSAHRARQLTPSLARGFDLVLVMEAGHQREVEEVAPTMRGRVQRLGRFGDFEVPDPYHHERVVFEGVLGLIERGLEDYHRAFWSRT